MGNWEEDDGFLGDKLLDAALAGAGSGIPADQFNDQFQVDLQKDLDVLATMKARLEELQGQFDPELMAMVEIMRKTPAKKVAVFIAYQDTVDYLKGQIRNRPELLNNRSWTAVIGSGSSADGCTRELERFCPESVNDEPGFQPQDGEVDVLLSTDILSEGQNLQQAQAVLSFDMPWNPQRVVQRNGRVIRLRSPHITAYLYTLLPVKGDLDRLLRLEAKLQAKIRAANAAVGTEPLSWPIRKQSRKRTLTSKPTSNGYPMEMPRCLMSRVVGARTARHLQQSCSARASAVLLKKVKSIA